MAALRFATKGVADVCGASQESGSESVSGGERKWPRCHRACGSEIVGCDSGGRYEESRYHSAAASRDQTLPLQAHVGGVRPPVRRDSQPSTDRGRTDFLAGWEVLTVDR